jgi:hypothetical protein
MYRALTVILVLALALGGCGATGQTQTQGELQITLATEPAPPLAGRPATLRFNLERAGVPLDDAQVMLTHGMAGMEHPDDRNPQPAQALGGGRYEARTNFVMGGRWSVAVIVMVPKRQQSVMTFQLDVEQP